MPGRRAAVDPSQVVRLIGAARSPRDRALLTVTYEHGLRASEVGILHLDDYDSDQGQLRIFRLKGLRSYDHQVYRRTAEALRSWLAERVPRLDGGAWIFPSRRHPCTTCSSWSRRQHPQRCPNCRATRDWGRHWSWGITRQGVYTIVRDCARRAGVAKSWPHVLRHSIVTHLLDAGEHPVDVQERAGHADLTTTWQYYASTKQSRAKSQAVLDRIWEGKDR